MSDHNPLLSAVKESQTNFDSLMTYLERSITRNLEWLQFCFRLGWIYETIEHLSASRWSYDICLNWFWKCLWKWMRHIQNHHLHLQIQILELTTVPDYASITKMETVNTANNVDIPTHSSNQHHNEHTPLLQAPNNNLQVIPRQNYLNLQQWYEPLESFHLKIGLKHLNLFHLVLKQSHHHPKQHLNLMLR